MGFPRFPILSPSSGNSCDVGIFHSSGQLLLSQLLVFQKSSPHIFSLGVPLPSQLVLIPTSQKGFKSGTFLCGSSWTSRNNNASFALINCRVVDSIQPPFCGSHIEAVYQLTSFVLNLSKTGMRTLAAELPSIGVDYCVLSGPKEAALTSVDLRGWISLDTPSFVMGTRLSILAVPSKQILLF